MACTLNISKRICVMRSTVAMGFGRASVSTTGWSSLASTNFDVECVTLDFLHVVREQSLARSRSSVPCRRPRIRSQVHCVLHDPRQRSVSESDDRAFRLEVRSGSTTGGSSGNGGSSNGGCCSGVSINRLVSIEAFQSLSRCFPSEQPKE